MSTEPRHVVHHTLPDGVRVLQTEVPGISTVLSHDALAFAAKLEREFGERRRGLLRKRIEKQIEINAGKMPGFLSSMEPIRMGYWKVAPCPADLANRKVEITGPPDRKMIINALNSGAQVYMADFEDACSPVWKNLIDGQRNLCDAVDRTITYTGPEQKHYQLNERIATLMVRPRGWHLKERHVTVDGLPMSASLFDFAIFFFHNARKLIERGTGPYFYLPKLEHHAEARLWNDVFLMAQDELGIPRGTIRATVLIETIHAAFEMHEILYELRDHSAGLNCGRWDYIFSLIKTFRHYPEFLLPDRSRITMMAQFLRSYSVLAIQTCHKHSAHAIGGMAAQIPIKEDPGAHAEAMARIRADKEREMEDGHDGTWVAHPGLVPFVRDILDAGIRGDNQLQRLREDASITADDLLTIPKGEITEHGIRTNIRVALIYIESWLRGQGCVPIDHLMEDTATAEISRAQLWQWVHSPNAMLTDHRRINVQMYQTLLGSELNKLRDMVTPEHFRSGKYHIAASLLDGLVLQREFTDFLTLKAYNYLDSNFEGAAV